MVGIVLVSHSADLARSLADYVEELPTRPVSIQPVGGDGRMGAAGSDILAAMRRADSGDGVVVLGDLGSSVYTVRHLLQHDQHCPRSVIADAPFVEGAVAAVMVAGSGGAMGDVAVAAEAARHVKK